MVERIRRKKGLATSSQEQDKLAASAQRIFEELQAKAKRAEAGQGTEKRSVDGSLPAGPTLPGPAEFQLQPPDPSVTGMAVNALLSPNPAVDASSEVGVFRRRPREESYRSAKGWRRRTQLDAGDHKKR